MQKRFTKLSIKTRICLEEHLRAMHEGEAELLINEVLSHFIQASQTLRIIGDTEGK
jgi:hypothetical protein